MYVFMEYVGCKYGIVIHFILYKSSFVSGDVLTGRVVCHRDRRDARALNVMISLPERKLKFILS